MLALEHNPILYKTKKLVCTVCVCDTKNGMKIKYFEKKIKHHKKIKHTLGYYI